MASQSVNSVSAAIGLLLELLNASEARDNGGTESVAAESLAVRGDKGGHAFLDPQAADDIEPSREWRQAEEDILAQAAEPSAWREPLAQPAAFSERSRLAIDNVENRFAAHIVQGMWMTKKD